LNVFDFRQHIVNEYSEFTRSFTRIKAEDIQSYVTKAYDSQKYWPEPLIQVNPNFTSRLTRISNPEEPFNSSCKLGSYTLRARRFSAWARTSHPSGFRCPCTPTSKRLSASPVRAM